MLCIASAGKLRVPCYTNPGITTHSVFHDKCTPPEHKYAASQQICQVKNYLSYSTNEYIEWLFRDSRIIS